MNSNIKLSSLTLAKGKDLLGDDFAGYKAYDNLVVAVVCDGVGSAQHGADAAKRSVNFLINALKNRPLSWGIEKSIRHFIQNINHLLYTESMEQYGRQEFVTTLALVVIEGDRLYGANVGDSRIYLKRDNLLTKLSLDHSMDEKGMENVLTQAIGLEDSVDPYYFENNLNKNDKILLCSDGLYNVLDEDEINSTMDAGASLLVKKASKSVNDNLPDDTTALLVEIDEVDHRLILKQSELIIEDEYKKGDVIDGYRLLKSLVQNGRTWLCENKGVEYVIKFAPKEAKEDERILDLFVKEVWTAKRLKAGFFPKVAIPANRTHRYYIMRYIKGEELKSFIEKKPLSVDLGIELGEFLLKMSQFLIRRDLLHADIKPENIIVTQRKGKSLFKMVDFGSITEVYSRMDRAGTPSYIAPERFANAPISEQTEIFAIGVSLYEALSGRLPFGEIEPFQTPSFDKAPKAPSKFNPKIPSWLDSVILRAIEIDPNKRYSHYSHMLYELNNPDKVKPYFDKNISYIQRYPLKVCRIALVVLLILNIIQFISK